MKIKLNLQIKFLHVFWSVLIFLSRVSMQVVLISGETGCGKTTQVTNSLFCLYYGTTTFTYNLFVTVSRLSFFGCMLIFL